ncbi:MAG: 2-oxoglutarate dehydrogenase E1 component [Alphaproteobacteria bacterium]|nr:2-oxoglutarate dehydrogenase E1 component [Alphaproteobacteria bacterium]
MSSFIEQTSFLNGANATFVAEIYAKYLENPNSIDPSWQDFFATLHDDVRELLDEMRGASWAPRSTAVVGHGANGGNGHAAPAAQGAPLSYSAPLAPQAAPDQVRQATLDSIRALMLIRSHRVRGHLAASLDPLGLAKPAPHPELDPATYGFTEADLDRPIFINFMLGFEAASVRQILNELRDSYCRSMGTEYMHIQGPEEKAWIQERVEGAASRPELSAPHKKAVLEALTRSEVFEQFLDKRYTGAKRFGLEGGETLIPALEQIVRRGGNLGMRELVIGMAHRGRLNVLATFMDKPFRAMFSEFEGNSPNPEDVMGSGDVKYHLGTSSDRTFDGNTVHLSLTPNPSHLEAVNTVVLGKVRAKQRQRGDSDREQVVGILLHGDAAFAGQGLVAETLDLSQLRGYRTGGTLHIITNNQIGFTTSPTKARSSPYSSDVAKMIQAPILHVNGDDAEASMQAARLATEYRYRFKADVVLDMWGYRRSGHNESDEPAFTQPIMYRKIAEQPTTRAIYAKQLEDEGVLEAGGGDRMVEEFHAKLDTEFEAAKSYRPNKADWLEGRWADIGLAEGEARRGDTAVGLELLKEVGHALATPPTGAQLNSKIVRQLKTKAKMFDSGSNIDWATGEALAFGSLLCESTPVRLSGEDVGRGTFSQRHAILYDQENEERHIPLNNIRFGQAPFECIDSPLSEFGVLGFEYGYSQAEPHALVLWEAQFGDFANGAQVIIDQFIAPGESKWLRMSGLVMLLPHGYEGQGPEHSSARLERYLQLCAEDNMQVCNITTPANYFHALRRQVRRNFRKPLVVMTPKSLLRHKLCVSELDDFGPGTTFHRVLYDNEKLCEDSEVKRVVLCSGKVYYDLFEERAKQGLRDVFFLRLEQLYPFPCQALIEELGRFPEAEIVWCQEEPQNMGAWTFIDRRLEEVMVKIGATQSRPRYVGRPEAASPATGSLARHRKEQFDLVNEALTG